MQHLGDSVRAQLHYTPDEQHFVSRLLLHHTGGYLVIVTCGPPPSTWNSVCARKDTNRRGKERESETRGIIWITLSKGFANVDPEKSRASAWAPPDCALGNEPSFRNRESQSFPTSLPAIRAQGLYVCQEPMGPQAGPRV